MSDDDEVEDKPSSVIIPEGQMAAKFAAAKAERQRKEADTLVSLKARLFPEGREQFEDKAIRRDKRKLIDQANLIIDEFAAREFKLTLRQLFYQFVARDLLPNKQKEYNRLGEAITDGRNLGLIRWDRIEDRTRFVRTIPSWPTPTEAIKETGEEYQEDLWLGQHWRPEVWIEKDALIGIIEGVCIQYRVSYFSNRGYCSEPLLYEAGKRFEKYFEAGLTPIVLHLGDHDPSGLQMTRNIEEKLRKFTRGRSIEVRRLALNEDQIDQFNPPPNLVKDTDSRSADYKFDYGNECWELDALDPDVVARLIAGELGQMIDASAWRKAEEKEEANRDFLSEVSNRWSEIVEFMKERR
jgi:hypothetical protein